MTEMSRIAVALARIDDRLESLEDAVGELTSLGILHDPPDAAIEDLAIRLRDAHGDALYMPWRAAPEADRTLWRDMARMAWARLDRVR